MSDTKELIIAQMLGSRLCHDLITPISAVTSGIELLADYSGSEADEIHNLIAKSAKTAAQRLVFYRFAFGFGGISKLNSLAKVKEIIAPYLDPEKFQLIWNVTEDVLKDDENLKTWAKLLSNLVLCAVESAPYGGDLKIATEDNSPNLSVTMQSSKIAFSNNICQVLELGCEVKHLTPQTIQPFMIWHFSNSLGRRVRVNQSTELLRIFTETN